MTSWQGHAESIVRGALSARWVDPQVAERALAAFAAVRRRSMWPRMWDWMADAAASSGGILVDALHSRYHPSSDRMRDIVQSGMLGEVSEVHFSFIVPRNILQPDDIRFRYDLAGGCAMDVGYYGVSFLRHILGAEPEAVLTAEANTLEPNIDGAMKVALQYPGGCVAHMDLSLIAAGEGMEDMVIAAEVIGSRGRMVIDNPVHPSSAAPLRLEIDGDTQTEVADPTGTYVWQARGFADNVRNGTPVLTPATESVAIMKVIDDIYRTAGLSPRGTAGG